MRKSFVIFHLQVTLILPIKFRVNLSYCSEEVQNRFSSCGGIIGFLNRTDLAIFDLKVIRILPVMFRVNWPFSSGEAQNSFLK